MAVNSFSGQTSGWVNYSGADWDTRKPIDWLPDWPFWRDCLRKYAPNQANVIELACGNGRITRQIAALGHQVTAVDINPRFLSRAQANLPTAYHEAVTFHLADVVHLDALALEPADAVLMTDWAFCALLNQEDQLQFFAGISNVLRPGAIFAFDTIFPTVRQLGLVYDGTQLIWEDGRQFDALTQVEIRYSGDVPLKFRHTTLAEIQLLGKLHGLEIDACFGNTDKRPLRGIPGDALAIIMKKVQ